MNQDIASHGIDLGMKFDRKYGILDLTKRQDMN